MASDNDVDGALSFVLADLRYMGCELRPDAVKRLRRVLAEDPERRERARQSMANGGRKGFRTRRSAQQGLSHDKSGDGQKSAGRRSEVAGAECSAASARASPGG